MPAIARYYDMLETRWGLTILPAPLPAALGVIGTVAVSLLPERTPMRL